MARIAFVKLFTGLNLGVSQLPRSCSAPVTTRRIIYFKDYIVVPRGRADRYR